MTKKPVGRPKKVGAKKAGDLKQGETRFAFITTKKTAYKIKDSAKKKGVKIKDFMSQVLAYYYTTSEVKEKEEGQLRGYLSKTKKPTD